MTTTMTQRHLRRTTLAMLLAATLGACGGGGGSPGATGKDAASMPAVEATVIVELVDRSGNKIQKLSGSTIAVARATVRDGAGLVQGNARVRFSVGNLLVMTPTDGVATTDSAGVAMVNVQIVDELARGRAAIIASVPALGQGVVDEIAVEVDGTIVR